MLMKSNLIMKETDIEKEDNVTRGEKFTGKPAKDVFTEVFTINDWSSTESHSGMGSTLEFTTNTRKNLPLLWEQYNIKKVLDIGCGDFNWMKEIISNLDYYKGTDIVDGITNLNIERHRVKGKIEFETCDIIEGCNANPKDFNAIILKDVLVHFPIDVANFVMEKLKKTGIKYIFITHFKNEKENADLNVFGQWRPLNMSIKPFNLGKPLAIITEEAEEYLWKDKTMKDKTLSLWKIN